MDKNEIESFNKFYNNSEWCGTYESDKMMKDAWLTCANEKNKEIVSLKAEFTATLLRIEKSINEMAQGSFFMSVKPQLAQYQSDDCVVVKKDDKTIVAIEKTVESQLQASGITDEPFRLDGEKILNAMIEAQEQANAKS